MSTLTLTIGGVDFLPRYKTGSATITSQIANQGDTCEMTLVIKTGQTPPAVGQELVFKDGSRFLFGGFITKLTPIEYGGGQLIEYTIEATDYTYILINKTAQKSYSNQTLNAIVTDLFSTNVAAGYGFTLTGVATGPTITTVNFNHISIRQCLENLAKLTGFIWYIDYQKVVSFVDPSGTITAAPEKITDSSGNVEDGMSITVDVSQVKNDVVVLGGTQESLQYTQVILGDGNAREWVLVYPVQTMGSIELDTGGGYVTEAFGIDPKDDEAGNDFMYSPSRGSIRATGTTTTPTTTTKVRIKFTYPLPVLTEVKSAPSIIAMAALEGGDGLHKFTISDATIVSQDQAVQRALMELDQFANPILSGQFTTRTGLLQAGSYWRPGTVITVNLPSWGISTDTTYIVQKVVTTLDESGSAIEYHYTVTFGGRLLGVLDFLQALATPEEPLDTSGEVQTIQALAEVVTIAETITRNNNVRSIAEIVTTAETVSKINFTPPYQWQPSANPAKWNKAEWK